MEPGLTDEEIRCCTEDFISPMREARLVLAGERRLAEAARQKAVQWAVGVVAQHCTGGHHRYCDLHLADRALEAGIMGV